MDEFFTNQDKIMVHFPKRKDKKPNFDCEEVEEIKIDDITEVKLGKKIVKFRIVSEFNKE